MKLKAIFLIIIVHLGFACQKRPAVSPAADNMSSMEAPPMGAKTYNDELKLELIMLDEVLNSTIALPRLKRVKEALMEGKFVSEDKNSDDARLAKVLFTLPELIHSSKVLNANERSFFKAKYYFIKHRFIEAAELFARLTRQDPGHLDPHHLEARNLLARCYFFLRNPDQGVLELEQIIKYSGEKSAAGLDALFLTGVIIFESDDNDHPRLDRGIKAWQRYLELAEAHEELTKEIQNGLAALKLRRDPPPASSLKNEANDPFAPQPQYSEEKNEVLRTFAKEELLLALKLAEQHLANNADPEIKTIKARILFKSGKLEEAAALFAQIVEEHKNYAPGYHYQGMSFMLKGEPKEAIASWQKALACDANYANSHGLQDRIKVAQKAVQN